MTYRLLVILAWSLGVLFLQAAPRPDILVYLSDDHSQFDSSLYGDPSIQTPELEKLADDGMTFTHAFIASPSCAPSRGAMLTGLMPARNGAEDNHSYPREGIPSLIERFNHLGYQTVAFGKVAHGRGGGDFGFQKMDRKSAYQGLKTTTTQFLKNRKDKRPLCLFVGISNPHVPWPMKNDVDPAKVTFPPHHIDTPSTREHRAAYMQEIHELDHFMGELRGLAARHLGKDHIFLHTSDHGSQWPFGKWTLYDYGTRVPFIVSWPGVIESGTRTDAMVSWVDILPTLLDAVGEETPKNLDGRSFLPVLKGEKKHHRERIFVTHTGDKGVNVYPSRSVRTEDWKLIWNPHTEFAFTTHSDLYRKVGAGAYWTEWVALSKKDAAARAILDRYYQRPEWELYHVGKDRWEFKNLSGDPAQSKRLVGLKKELQEWMKKQGDTIPVLNEPRLLSEPSRWSPDVDLRKD